MGYMWLIVLSFFSCQCSILGHLIYLLARFFLFQLLPGQYPIKQVLTRRFFCVFTAKITIVNLGLCCCQAIIVVSLTLECSLNQGSGCYSKTHTYNNGVEERLDFLI